MINPDALLLDLKKLLGQLEDDLRERAGEVPVLGESLRSAYQRARQAERTAQPFETWREEYLTQAAVAWILACVFVRFIEDNGLIDTPLLAGSGSRLDEARDQRTLYFQRHPTDSDREYLYYVFRNIQGLPAAAPLFDERHNPLWAFGVSGDGATLLMEFWQRIDPATGVLAHDFVDPTLNTRFLGDLYQDLSVAARKKYALLQTPEFVEEFILDRTLTPAIAEFGLAEVRLIDPACGSGHFLLGAFHRMLHEWQRREPAVNVRVLAQRSLDAVHGVDLNPYAVAIARFRLLIAALKAAEVHRLADTPAFRMNLATGDSLLHGPRPGGERQLYLAADTDPLRHVYDTEDADELRRLLGTRYHVVVGNPPYITVKDRALNDAYRRRFGSCHMKYSLAVPFMERFFDLALSPEGDNRDPSGFVGMITANSFIKREFGRKLIEQYIPQWDITHVMDTSGAYIPGHTTSTLLLFGRSRRPATDTVRMVLGITGEPGVPAQPAQAAVWTAIVKQADIVDSVSHWVSVADVPRERLSHFPWSLGGGGASDLKAALEEACDTRLQSAVDSIGFSVIIAEDEAFVHPKTTPLMRRLPSDLRRDFIQGEDVRDWAIRNRLEALFPYTDEITLRKEAGILEWLWPYRTVLWDRPDFSGQTYRECGRTYWEYHQIPKDRNQRTRHLAIANVATHNHVAYATAQMLFDRHAPIITLPADASEDDHYFLLGLLNSSSACFWLKQVMNSKGLGGQGGGIKSEEWHRAYEFDSTKLLLFPVPERSERLIELARAMTRTMEAIQAVAPSTVVADLEEGLSSRLEAARSTTESMYRCAVAMQEEMDWIVYSLYGVGSWQPAPQSLCASGIDPEHRPCEQRLKESLAAGEVSTFYSVHKYRGTKPVALTELDGEIQHWIRERKRVVDRDTRLQMLESVNHKRRWQVEPWDSQVKRALESALLTRLEAPFLWASGELRSASRLADQVRGDNHFMKMAECYRGRADFDVTGLIVELIELEAVPFLPVLRYTQPGLRKRALWEATWATQRKEDALSARAHLEADSLDRPPAGDVRNLNNEQVGEIEVPPKYKSTDFRKAVFWNARGKLDVPRERFTSYPHGEREADATLVVGWAGWDHLQRAKAIAAYYVRMKEQDGWPPERLQPFLAGLIELIPWLKQWHNDLDAAYGIGMGDYFAGFVDEEARALGSTVADLRAWQPPAGNTRRRRRAGI